MRRPRELLRDLFRELTQPPAFAGHAFDAFNQVDRYGTLKEFMMKTYIVVLTMIGAIVGQSAFAQSAAPLTRAQVRDELMRLEAAGYDPAKGDEGEYPADIQAAEAKLAEQDRARMAAAAAHAPAAGMPAQTSN